MKQTSTEFKTVAESFDGSAHYYIRILSDGIEVTDEVIEFKYTHICNNSTNFSVGNTASATVEIKINQPTFEITDKIIEIYQGLTTVNGIEYVKMGKFKILSQEIERFQATYQCVDAMTYAMATVYESALTYPTTDIAILEEICQQSGIELANTDLVAHTIDKKLDNYTKREMIGFIAQLQGKNAIINDEGKLELIWYSECDYIVDDNRIYSDRIDIVKNSSDYVLGYIKSTYGSKELVAGDVNAQQGIKITNPYMTQEILNEVFDKIKNFTFRALELDFYGDFRLEVGDIVTVNSGVNNYIVPIMSLEQSSDGGVVTTIGSIGETATQNSVDTNGSILNEIKRSVVNSDTARSIAEQSADKINFVVEGDSVSEFTVTDNVIQATTEKLVIKTDKGGEVVIENGIMYVNDIFAEEITATGSITGAKLYGATGEFEGDIASYGTVTLYSGAWGYYPDGTKEFIKDAGALMLSARGVIPTIGAMPTEMHLMIGSNLDAEHKTFIDLTNKNVLRLEPQNSDGSGGAEMQFGLGGIANTEKTLLTVKPEFTYKLSSDTTSFDTFPSPHIERLMLDKLAAENAYLENITTVNPLTVNANSYYGIDIKRLNSKYNVGIRFENQNGVLGHLVISAVDGKFQRMLGSDTSKVYDLIDASGGTLSGNLDISVDTASWTHFSVKNSLREVRMAINASGYFGFYDVTNSKWLLQSGVTGNGISINGQAFTAESTDTSTTSVIAKNSKRRGGITVSDTGFYGLWDFTNDKWTIYSDTNDTIFCNGALTLLGDMQTHNVIPATNATSTAGYTVGNANFKYRYIYAYSSAIQTSDKNYKHTINYDMNTLDGVFDALKPCTYYMQGGDRKHMGFIAQDVEEAMNENGMTIDDLSFVCKDAEYKLIDENKPDTEENREYQFDDNGEQKHIYGLKYTELHALEVDQIQKLKTRVSDLEFALSQALARIEMLEEKINK